jgi:hypothetical protein
MTGTGGSPEAGSPVRTVAAIEVPENGPKW